MKDHRRPWRAGLAAARAHLVPGLVLQAAGLALVLSYYFWPWAGGELNAVMDLKRRLGFSFGMVSTGLFGGFLPWLYLRSVGRYSGRQGAWLTLFWTYKGLEIDLLYRLEAHWVGAGHDARTIVAKVFIDQFLYCPFFAVPGMVLIYDWVDRSAAPRSLTGAEGSEAKGRRNWYRERVLPILISNAGVWVPMTALIYALPTPLQLPLENLVLCFFTLILAHQSRRDSAGLPKAIG